MALHIDTSNVTLMSEFKDAIEDYVQNYVQEYVNVTLGGTHKEKADSSWKFEGGTAEKTHDLYMYIPCGISTSSNHWGVINIKRNDIEYKTDGVQIFFWFNGTDFQYSLNTKRIHETTRSSSDNQSVESVTYANNTITIKVTNHSSGSYYPSASFSVDYHIW